MSWVAVQGWARGCEGAQGVQGRHGSSALLTAEKVWSEEKRGEGGEKGVCGGNGDGDGDWDGDGKQPLYRGSSSVAGGSGGSVPCLPPALAFVAGRRCVSVGTGLLVVGEGKGRPGGGEGFFVKCFAALS